MEIDRSKYKVWDKKSFGGIHYVLNPGIAIIELILGMRVPKILLADKTSDKPLLERTYIPCPHCETFHDGRTWSHQNKTGFKNWFGLFCPNCGETIPCLRNWTSKFILALTYPLWFWWVDSFKQSWLAKQPKRYANLDFSPSEDKKLNPFLTGIVFGASMFTVITLSLLLGMPKSEAITIIVSMFPVCILAGFAFGFLLKWKMERKSRSTI